MERAAFIDSLKADGFAEPVLIERAPDTGLDDHAHPFEARALILDGQITIVAGGNARVYRPGDVFHLRRDEPHAERYGPQGVRYLSGRR
jgi:quercetin dioxygenase-like cupin family protein